MQVWKRRVLVLVAGAVASGGLLMSTASAQVPPDFPNFPSIPGFTLPTFTIPPPPTTPPSSVTTTSPPPTMPPSSVTTTSPPPTMPPTSFPTITVPTPPTMPPTTIEARDVLEDIFDDIIESLEGDGLFDDLRATLDAIIADFGG
jgi:hypothetical protein